MQSSICSGHRVVPTTSVDGEQARAEWRWAAGEARRHCSVELRTKQPPSTMRSYADDAGERPKCGAGESEGSQSRRGLGIDAVRIVSAAQICTCCSQRCMHVVERADGADSKEHALCRRAVNSQHTTSASCREEPFRSKAFIAVTSSKASCLLPLILVYRWNHRPSAGTRRSRHETRVCPRPPMWRAALKAQVQEGSAVLHSGSLAVCPRGMFAAASRRGF